jgi:malate dehydrogenase (oxaloacetate-decarboxylating)
MLDSGSHQVTDRAMLAAATAIADCVSSDQLAHDFIVPSVFDAHVAPAVANAVRTASSEG